MCLRETQGEHASSEWVTHESLVCDSWANYCICDLLANYVCVTREPTTCHLLVTLVHIMENESFKFIVIVKETFYAHYLPTVMQSLFFFQKCACACIWLIFLAHLSLDYWLESNHTIPKPKLKSETFGILISNI